MTSPDETVSALVRSLTEEVRQLRSDIPDVYISKTEVRQMRRRLRMGLIFNFAMGLLVVLAFFAFRAGDRRSTEQDRTEVVATDRAFCALANDSRGHINTNRNAIRALESAIRQSYELVIPAPDATAIQRQRINDFRSRILALLDTVKVDGNLALLDCSGIGNGRVDFSLQDAIRDLPTATTAPG